MRNNWFVPLNSIAKPRAWLICFPFAGGSALSFRDWKTQLPEGLQLVGVDMPGRGMRFGESLLYDTNTIIKALMHEIKWLQCRKPFIFFGHSLGALLAFELTRALETAGNSAPIHLVVSGRNAPHLPRKTSPIHNLPDESFIKEMAKYEGTPPEILEDKEIMELFLPILRADFTVSETYKFSPNSYPIKTSITAISGQDDHMIDIDQLSSWKQYTNGNFSQTVYDGGHFFINDHCAKIIRNLVTKLAI